MKIKHLLEILSNFDPDTDIGVLHDNGVYLANMAGIYEGTIHIPHGNKMIYNTKNDKYLIIGNPGDYDSPSYWRNNNPIEVYDVLNDGTIKKEKI